MAHTKKCAIEALMARDQGSRIHCSCGEWQREDDAKNEHERRRLWKLDNILSHARVVCRAAADNPTAIANEQFREIVDELRETIDILDKHNGAKR